MKLAFSTLPMPDYAGEKNIDPTPHRREQARREGHVAKSHDLGSAVVLLAGVTLLLTLGGSLAGFLADYCREQLGGRPWLTIDAETAVCHWNSTLWTLARYMLPILGLLCLAGAAIHVFQVGFLFLPQRLAMDFTRLDPLKGLQRLFSMAGVVRIGFGVGKVSVVLAVAGAVLYNQRGAILGLGNLAPPEIAAQSAQIIFWTAVKISAALLFLALLDYAYQWWRHDQDLKMTPQELREELRNLEGNPQIIARRKQMRRDLSIQRIGKTDDSD